jgi:hypothetical protein
MEEEDTHFLKDNVILGQTVHAVLYFKASNFALSTIIYENKKDVKRKLLIKHLFSRHLS